MVYFNHRHTVIEGNQRFDCTAAVVNAFRILVKSTYGRVTDVVCDWLVGRCRTLPSAVANFVDCVIASIILSRNWCYFIYLLFIGLYHNAM